MRHAPPLREQLAQNLTPLGRRFGAIPNRGVGTPRGFFFMAVYRSRNPAALRTSCCRVRKQTQNNEETSGFCIGS